jgi:hypothetical protein
MTGFGRETRERIPLFVRNDNYWGGHSSPQLPGALCVYHLQPQHLLERIEIVIAVQKLIPGEQAECSGLPHPSSCEGWDDVDPTQPDCDEADSFAKCANELDTRPLASCGLLLLRPWPEVEKHSGLLS